MPESIKPLLPRFVCCQRILCSLLRYCHFGAPTAFSMLVGPKKPCWAPRSMSIPSMSVTGSGFNITHHSSVKSGDSPSTGWHYRKTTSSTHSIASLTLSLNRLNSTGFVPVIERFKYLHIFFNAANVCVFTVTVIISNLSLIHIWRCRRRLRCRSRWSPYH